jgi:MFS family permease
MLTGVLNDTALQNLTRDGWLLFLTRFTRLFAYGALSVILVLYLTSLGLSAPQTGMVLTLTLVGDTVVSLFLTTRADRMGRRRMLIVGAFLMAGAGFTFASTSSLLLLTIAGTIFYTERRLLRALKTCGWLIDNHVASLVKLVLKAGVAKSASP